MTPAELGKFVREEVPKAKEAAARYPPSKESLGARALLDALDCAMGVLREAKPFVEMAGAADNSGQEYPPQCQECDGNNDYHTRDCRLSLMLATLCLVLGEPTP